VIILACAMIFHFLPSRLTSRTIARFSLLPVTVQAIILAIVLFIVIQTRQSDLVPFVYLQY
ncbi:MAG: MBOAT family protein, partial [Muribaculaceae bacterium]|nr:MBOAT family protein [Muribaculaceae bacterium]